MFKTFSRLLPSNFPNSKSNGARVGDERFFIHEHEHGQSSQDRASRHTRARYTSDHSVLLSTTYNLVATFSSRKSSLDRSLNAVEYTPAAPAAVEKPGEPGNPGSEDNDRGGAEGTDAEAEAEENEGCSMTIFATRLLFASATYTLPAPSTATAQGSLNSYGDDRVVAE